MGAGLLGAQLAVPAREGWGGGDAGAGRDFAGLRRVVFVVAEREAEKAGAGFGDGGCGRGW